MTRTEKLLTELIALPSVNPAFARQSRASARHASFAQFGEKNIAEFLASVAARASLEVEFQTVLPVRFNVIAHLLPQKKARQTILLAPHMDTVPAEDSQFIPRRKDSRLYGRGACDTKGSIAAMLTALCELAESRSRPRETEIVFAGLVDEEHAQAGSRTFVRSSAFRQIANSARRPKAGLQTALAIVGEPTKLQGITAHKGSLWLQLETRGKAAHGAMPHLGKNAIHKMANVVEALETDYAAQLRKHRHPVLGRATVNVGSISGGAQPNIVPDHCTITIDRRTLPGETDAAVRREIDSFLKSKHLRASISSIKLAPAPPFESNPNLPLLGQFLRSIGQRRPAGVDFFCDAAVLSAGGIPSVVFGPGDISQAHTPNEWISLASLERGKNLLLRFLNSLP